MAASQQRFSIPAACHEWCLLPILLTGASMHACPCGPSIRRSQRSGKHGKEGTRRQPSPSSSTPPACPMSTHSTPQACPMRTHTTRVHYSGRGWPRAIPDMVHSEHGSVRVPPQPGAPLLRISDLSPSYHPLHSPLLFPHTALHAGWTLNMRPAGAATAAAPKRDLFVDHETAALQAGARTLDSHAA